LAERPPNQPARVNPSRDYGNLPLAFEPNLGQTDGRVRFLARGGGMTAFFTDTETVMALSRRRQAKKPEGLGRLEAPADQVEQAVVRMKLENARPRRVTGLEKLPGISNYFIGNDPAKWRTNVPQYARIQYEDVYPGIDVAWYGNQGRLEYDFVVAPGADPKQIRVAYEGTESLKVEANGDLTLRTKLGEVRQQKPRVYQEVGGKQVEVGARYAILAGSQVSFELAGYDRKRALRIDPLVLVYSTYLGGITHDYGYGIAVDAAGSAYIAGYTWSTNFPTQSPYQATLQGSYNAFVTKLTPAGDALAYSTYLGGNKLDQANGIAVDAAGSAYVAGIAESTDFPTESPFQATLQGTSNAFVTKLTPAGDALAYSTYLGGSGSDYGYGIAVDAAGSAYVTGTAGSTDFPTQSPYLGTRCSGVCGNAFVTKLTPAGNALAYSTYLGGSSWDYGYGIAVDAAGSAYVTGMTESHDFPTQSPFQATLQGGENAFVTKLTPVGNAPAYSTFLGGNNLNQAYGIAVDAAGSAYVTGRTVSTNFPTQSPYLATAQGNYDAFVTKLTPAGNALAYSTYLGGSGADYGCGIAVDAAGSAYVTGYTNSTNFPTQSPYQATFQGVYDVFVTKLTPAGDALAYSTYLGGTNDDEGYGIAVDAYGSAYVAGYTSSTNFPTQSPYQASKAGGYDVFIAKLAEPSILSIGKTHTGNFAQGQAGATYTVTASNAASGGATSGTVTVTEAPPSGLTLVSMAGAGWTCPAGGTTCTRSDALAAGSSYPAITVTVNVAANATSPQVNKVSVSGGGASTSQATDSTDIEVFAISGPSSLPAGQVGVAYAATAVTATGGSGSYAWSATGLPAGLGIGAATGIISGTPATNSGSPYTVQVTVTDGASAQATRGYSLTIDAASSPLIAGVSNAASGQAAIAPNAFVSIYGSNFTAAGFIDDWSQSITNGNLPTTLDGVSVSVGGNPAYVSFVSPGQINVLTPNVAPGNAAVTVTAGGATTAPMSVTSQQFSPAFFPWPNGQPVATHLDYSWAAKNGTFAGATTIPAKPGEVIILWGTGFGPTSPPAPAGVTVPATTTYNAANAVSVTIGNGNASVYGTALASGFAGLYQVVVTVPAPLANGDYALVATVGGVATATTMLTVQN
jgi:uncharacterized protein (TIGR03437 family)